MNPRLEALTEIRPLRRRSLRPRSTALAETVTLRFVQTNDIDRMEEDDGRGGFAKLAAVVKRSAPRGTTFFVHSGDTHLALAALRHRQGRAHHRHPEPHGRRRDDARQPRIRLRPGDFPRPHRRGEVPDRHLQRPRSRRRPAGQHRGREDRRGRGREDRLLRPDHGGHAGRRHARATSNSLDEVETARAKQAESARERAPISSSPSSTADRRWTWCWCATGAADLVLSGHDEHLLTYYNGKTALTESYSQADFVVVTKMTIDKTEKDGKVSVCWTPAFDIVDTIGVEPDPEIAAVVRATRTSSTRSWRSRSARRRRRSTAAAPRCAARRRRSATCSPTRCARRSAPTSRSPMAAASAPTGNIRPARS